MFLNDCNIGVNVGIALLVLPTGDLTALKM